MTYVDCLEEGLEWSKLPANMAAAVNYTEMGNLPAGEGRAFNKQIRLWYLLDCNPGVLLSARAAPP